MVNRIFNKYIYLSIKSNIKSFLSIVCIILLGVGFFVGMRSSTPNMKNMVDTYYKKANFMDIHIISTIGLKNDELDDLSNSIKEIKYIEGSYTKNIILSTSRHDVVVSLNSYSGNKINKLEVLSGRLPDNENECVVEKGFLSRENYKIGDIINFNNSGSFLKNKNVKIVGTVKSPMYISGNRGTTNLLSGVVNYYIYLNVNNIVSDVYNDAYLTINYIENYSENVNRVIDEINKVKLNITSERYRDTISTYKSLVTTKEKELNTVKARIGTDIQKYEAQIIKYEDELKNLYVNVPSMSEIQIEIDNKKVELKKAKVELDNAKSTIDSKKVEYNESKKTADETTSGLNVFKNYSVQSRETSKSQLASTQTTLNSQKATLSDLQEQYNNTSNPTTKSQLQSQIDSLNSSISSNEALVQSLSNQINNFNMQIDIYQKEIDDINNQLLKASAEISKSENDYNSKYSEYTKALNEVNNANASKIYSDSTKQLDAKKIELEQQKKEIEQKKDVMSKEITKAENELGDAKTYLRIIENTDWYVLDRTSNIGYNNYIDDITRIDNLGKIFPLIFYIVAALITLTSISRMIEEERMQIGILKALGYKKSNILLKYLIYIGSATLIGSVIGVILGILIIPNIIYKVYSMIYNVPNSGLFFDYGIIFVSIVLALFFTITVALITCYKSVIEKTSVLMRPKVPPTGKRILIEKSKYLWSKLIFINKITIRNLFRYKKRLIMTVAGVAGCVALIIASFSLRSSIANMIPLQYGDIFKIDMRIVFKDSITRAQIAEEESRISKLPELNQVMSASLETFKVNNTNYSAYVVVPEDNDLLYDFINLRNRVSNKKYQLPKEGVLITEKIASLLKIKIGDSIKITDSLNNSYNVIVKGVCENYLDNYIYIDKNYYQELTNEIPRYNVVLTMLKSNNYNRELLSKEISKNNYFSSITYTSIAKDTYQNVMKNLNYIVYILVVSAVILAFVVLYNLISININERRREIATLKVLGFNYKETRKYVSNEIYIITFMGIIAGIFLGRLISVIVIKECELTNMMFNYHIDIYNYIYAILITVIFTILTIMFTKRTLKRINMVESLKSIE